MWVWLGLAWARYFALSLPTAAAAAAAGEAPVARAGFFPRLRDVQGVAAWPAEAVARPTGAAVATPRTPSSSSSAAAAAAGEAPVARAGSVPRFRGVLGVTAWPAEEVARLQPLARPPRSSPLLWRPPARRLWPVRGPFPAFAACWGSRRGRPRRWRSPPGPRS